MVKNPSANAEDLGSIPGLGRTPGEEKGYQLQYSGLENSMDCRVHEVAKSQTQLSDFHFTSLHIMNSYTKMLKSCHILLHTLFIASKNGHG